MQARSPARATAGSAAGDQTGALARGMQPMKPAKPTSQHSTAGGKDIWGHLPDELRQDDGNSFKETALDSKAELISRYFLSVGKGKPVAGGVTRWRSPCRRVELVVVRARIVFGLVLDRSWPAAGGRRSRLASRPSRSKVSARPVGATSPKGPLEMMTPETDKAIKNGLAWLAPHPERRRLVRQRDLSRQHRRDQPGRAGLHGVGLEPGPWAVWGADRQGAGLRDGQHVALGLHRGCRRRRRTARCIRMGSARCSWRKPTG